LLHINHLAVTEITNTADNNIQCKLVLFSDDEIQIITIPNTTDFIEVINGEFTNINSKLKVNWSLNLERKCLIQFLIKNSSRNNFCDGSDDNILTNITNKKVLRIVI
jgi:hypothetical protein